MLWLLVQQEGRLVDGAGLSSLWMEAERMYSSYR